ncbi:MAG TPA: ankyrin repeat domain-containing protein [Candidatus Limnocylindrales bacterium]|jgi:ankyrin repeat protein|nr:ankyrin repeat domain-containing protein [Candidatus Limnocylindrales bacterium]
MSAESELFEAIDAGDAVRVTALLGDDPGLASARGDDGVSALLRARYRFDRPVLEALLAADPDMDVFDAAALGHLDRLQARLEEDPKRATAFASDGFTALHLAAFFGKAEIARRLLDAGASPLAYGRNDFANQPLHAAAAGRHIEVCRVLLAAGADVDAAQHGGFRPLHEAAQHGDDEMVELFLSAGADPAATDGDGKTAADRAEAAGHLDVAHRLRTARTSPQP